MAEIVAAAASAVVVEAYKDARNAADSIDEMRYYEKSLDKNYEKLQDAIKKVYARKGDLLVKINRDRTKQATEECNVWMGSVKKLEKEVLALKAEYEEEKSHKFKSVRLCPRSNLSKRMVEKLFEVQSCWSEGSNFGTDFLVERSAKPIIKAKAPKIEDKPSLSMVFEEILERLKDKRVTRIGLWGQVGAGKTTIMQNLRESEEISELFDIVFYVTLADEGNEERLQERVQHQIAEELQLDLLQGSTDAASKISKRLESMRFLLLLDVWGTFDLDDCGIYENEKDSKIVIASRHCGNCREMCVDHLIRVPRLSNDEALNLFQERLGRKLYSEFESLACQVIEQCDNLPLLIDKVARAFRRKDDILLWESGLNKLRIWPGTKCDGMDDAFDLLRFCYEELDEDGKVCFLYGALYAEAYEICINYLLECWRAEDFTQDVEEFTAIQKGQEILHDLLDASLLENGEKVKHVRMNKVLRKMAFKILESDDSKCLVKPGKGLQKAPESKEWEQKLRISLMDNKFSSLPDKPDCNNLSTLLLQRNIDLAVIPRRFFESMQSLRVLDLHSTNIAELPSSISCLVCLRALYLNSCRRLSKLPGKIKALKHLEVLDIRGTGINSLPVEIRYLSQLQRFRMSLSKIDGKSRKIRTNHNIILELSLLEELVIDIHPENEWWKQVVRDITQNVAVLKKLTYLSFSIGEYHSTRYKILDCFRHRICRRVKYANGDGNLPLPEVLAEADAFELIGCKGVLKLSDFGIDNMTKIKSCLIESCNEMETVVDSNGITNAVFECLEKMYLSNIPNLQSIWEGLVPQGSLARLNTLVFFKCSKLKKIFSSSLVQQFSDLQHLEIEACHQIEEVTLEAENNGMNAPVLPSLKSIVLVGLPSLTNIWIDDSLDWASLDKTISMCPLLDSHPSWRTVL
ncbi:hypothetical protein GH714_024026 [Hevea brasiliensis]|uniref:Uncharacterized protein n=1 Tax=Hevea brasiliensis TaxID=3981 RepID=A0A6A6N5I4_HEVBR|nr:hypothetical protein GH714_024026 [Hevea brasiliensis]